MAKKRAAQGREIWMAPLLVWGALSALLAATCVFAYIPLGAFNLPLSLCIAAVKSALIGAVFMRLHDNNPLHRLAASVGPIWILIMFVLIGADYLTR
jgi:cytochrome c oxidase subunit IV